MTVGILIGVLIAAILIAVTYDNPHSTPVTVVVWAFCLFGAVGGLVGYFIEAAQ